MQEQNTPYNQSMPFVVERSADGERTFDLASRLMQDRNIVIDTGFDDRMAHIIKMQLLYLDSRSAEDIYMYINSPGGVVHAGLSIKDIAEMRRSKIVTIGNGLCASMGCYTLSTVGSEGKRLGTKRLSVMCHQVSSGTKGHIEDQMISLKHTTELNELLMGEIADRVGVSLDKLMDDARRDMWTGAEASLNYGKYGFIDGIYTGKRNEKGQYEVKRRNNKFEWI